MLGRPSLAIVLLLAAAPIACASAPPPPPPPPPALPPAPPPPPPPVAARWVFQNPGRALAQANVDGGVLQVGEGGRRWIIPTSGEVKQAEGLAPARLVDVRVDGPRVEALGGEGDLFVADALLGPVTLRTPAPHVHHVVAYRFGRAAILGATETGALWRAPSAGAPWVESRLPLAPGERVFGLETDRKGRVAILLSPQRLLVSMDDGVTFAPAPLVGIGAVSLGRDGNGDLWLNGAGDAHARLDGATLVRGGDAVALASLKPPVKDPTAPPAAPFDFLAGDRLVGVTYTRQGHHAKYAVAIHAFDAPVGEPQVLAEGDHPELVVRGYKGTVTIARTVEGDDAKVELLQTTDDGRTLSPLASIDGVPQHPLRLLVGPGGWAMVSPICKADGQCSPPQVHIGDAWQPLDKEASSAFFQMPAWDEKNGRVYLWNNAARKIQFLRTTGPDLADVPIKLNPAPLAMAVDDAGTLLVVHGSPARITRVPLGGEALPPSFLPFQPQDIAFAGAHGFAVSEASGWETTDAGAHWTKVGGTAAETGKTGLACVAWGCLGWIAMRIGWDLPAVAGESVATTEKAPTIEDADQAPPPPPVELPVKLSCIADDRRTPFIDGYSPTYGGSGDVRWESFRWAKISGEVTVGRAGAALRSFPAGVRETTRHGWTFRGWSSTSNKGAVSGYFSFGPKAADGSYAPVDAELGWYDAATGKVGHVKIPRMKPFRVGRSNISALIDQVDGGIVLLPGTPDSPIYFAHRDGKVETFPPPPAGISDGFQAVVKVGSRIVLMATLADSYVLAATSDLGKTWTSTTWTLGGDADLAVVNGAPVLLVRRDNHLLTVLSLDTLGPDLPSWKAGVDRDPAPLAVCPPATLADTSAPSTVAGGVSVTITSKSGKGAPLTLTDASRFVRVNADGTTCTAAIDQAREGVDAVIAPHDLAHGYLLQTDHGKRVWSALSCTATP